jgi:hypothetical protein
LQKTNIFFVISLRTSNLIHCDCGNCGDGGYDGDDDGDGVGCVGNGDDYP